MKYKYVLFILLGLAAVFTLIADTFPVAHTIAGVIPGVSNCYLKNNDLSVIGGNERGDLQVQAHNQAGYPLCMLATQYSPHERFEVWLMKYAIDAIVKGSTTYKTLEFIVVEHWDDRVKAKKFWPWPKQITFSLDPTDYRIVHLAY